MCKTVPVFINPFTDYGFKKLFGEESSKPQLISFINAFLELENKDKIVDLEFRNLEKLGLNLTDRKLIYDIYCTDEKGNHIIVELQKAKQNYFKDRMVYYSSFLIQEQGVQELYYDPERPGKNKNGNDIMRNWNYKLKAIYCVGILDFELSPKTEKEEEIVKDDYLHIVKLKDQKNRLFYDKLTYVFVEMPKFTKKENEIITYLDKWFYFLNNLDSLTQIPEIFKDDEIIMEAFDKAKYLNLSPHEREQYFYSLKSYRDIFSIIETAEQKSFEEGIKEGIKEGIEKGKLEIAREMLNKNMDVNLISTITKLSVEQLKKIPR